MGIKDIFKIEKDPILTLDDLVDSFVHYIGKDNGPKATEYAAKINKFFSNQDIEREIKKLGDMYKNINNGYNYGLMDILYMAEMTLLSSTIRAATSESIEYSNIQSQDPSKTLKNTYQNYKNKILFINSARLNASLLYRTFKNIDKDCIDYINKRLNNEIKNEYEEPKNTVQDQVFDSMKALSAFYSMMKDDKLRKIGEYIDRLGKIYMGLPNNYKEKIIKEYGDIKIQYQNKSYS